MLPGRKCFSNKCLLLVFKCQGFDKNSNPDSVGLILDDLGQVTQLLLASVLSRLGGDCQDEFFD